MSHSSLCVSDKNDCGNGVFNSFHLSCHIVLFLYTYRELIVETVCLIHSMQCFHLSCHIVLFVYYIGHDRGNSVN